MNLIAISEYRSQVKSHVSELSGSECRVSQVGRRAELKHAEIGDIQTSASDGKKN